MVLYYSDLEVSQKINGTNINDEIKNLCEQVVTSAAEDQMYFDMPLVIIHAGLCMLA
jgi:hypothetical protein